jgi:hypothetical protein
MTSAATPVSTAAKQQHDYDDNQEQFHGTSPLMVGRHRRPAASPFNWSSNERTANFSVRRIDSNACKVKLFRWCLHKAAQPRFVTIK